MEETKQNLSASGKLKAWISKGYRLEICVEACIIVLIFLCWITGQLHFDNVVSDGTFMAAALSLPVVIVQYITSKKEDKQKKADKLEEDKKAFYNDTLDKMLKITNFGEEKRRNRSKIEFKMLQLNSYINSADKREDHDRELFKNAAAVTYFELVAQGIDIQMTEEIDLINVDQLIADLYDIDATIKETIDTRKDLFNNEAETKYDTVDDAAYAELGRM